MRGVVARTRHVLSDLLYERRYRTRTTEKLTLDTHDAENICYSPVGWRQLPRVLPPDSVTERDVFVDLGSGKGRAVLEAAATYPFARVIGVELVPELHEVATRNVAATTRKLRCRNIELVQADLREYQLPDDVTVVFMNNSVRGSILAAVLTEIAASRQRRPRALRLVYGSPVEEDAVLAAGGWRKVRTVTPRGARWPYGAFCVYELPREPVAAG